MKKKKQLKLVLLPKLWASLLYLLFVFTTLFLYLSKYLDVSFFTSMYPDFYLHISNFSISLIIGLLGYFWLLVGAPFKAVTLLTLLLLIANLLSETVFGFMNTPDRIDLLFGIAGTIVAYFTLAMIKRYGLVKNQSFWFQQSWLLLIWSPLLLRSNPFSGKISALLQLFSRKKHSLDWVLFSFPLAILSYG